MNQNFNFQNAAMVLMLLIMGACSTAPAPVKSDPAVYGESLDAAIRTRKTDFAKCYGDELKSTLHPIGSGKVFLEWVISPTGTVSGAKVAETTLKNPNVEHCLIKTLTQIQFSPPVGRTPITVKYPFQFSH